MRHHQISLRKRLGANLAIKLGCVHAAALVIRESMALSRSRGAEGFATGWARVLELFVTLQQKKQLYLIFIELTCRP